MAKSTNKVTGKLADFLESRRFEDYIYTLVTLAYSDIKDRDVKVVWGSIGPNAVVISSHKKSDVIRCNRAVRNWPEPALYGLLSHELSHIALGVNLHSELQADKDVIERGLGQYLAVERVLTTKFEDHNLRNGEDRYLGYFSIRKLLKAHEIRQLDILLSNYEIAVDSE
ncbi:MAG: hypothetical protein ACFE7R_06780 [Candidatus Hodarchaeota archaeon]